MSANPLVSCIIPVFNGAPFLEEAVESIERQTYRSLEIIVVDDGSTDSTADVIARLGLQIRAVGQENRGPAAARNRGIAEARGDFIAFLDADDQWRPEKLELQMACFAEDPGLDLCTTQAEHFWAPEVEYESDDLRDELDATHGTGWLISMVVKRDLLDRVGTLNESLHHLDTLDFFTRAQDGGARLKVLPQRLVRRRIHSDNLSRNRAGEAEERLHIVQERLRRSRQKLSG